MFIVEPEKCRVCGCTELKPCDLGDGDLCAWVDFDHSLCSNPQCVAVIPLGELLEMPWLRAA
jgi:hypothetical protein